MSALANECFTKEEQAEIIEYLESFIKNGASVIEIHEFGICRNIEKAIEKAFYSYLDVNAYVRRLTTSAYPISGEYDYWDDAIDKYAGEQLALRKQLARKIIDDIKMV